MLSLIVTSEAIDCNQTITPGESLKIPCELTPVVALEPDKNTCIWIDPEGNKCSAKRKEVPKNCSIMIENVSFVTNVYCNDTKCAMEISKDDTFLVNNISWTSFKMKIRKCLLVENIFESDPKCQNESKIPKF